MITCQEMIRNLISLKRLKTFLFYLFPLFIFNWIINHRIMNVIVLDRCISFVLLDALSPCEQEVTIELGLEAKSVYHYKEPTYERWVFKEIFWLCTLFFFQSVMLLVSPNLFNKSKRDTAYEIMKYFINVYGFMVFQNTRDLTDIKHQDSAIV